MPGYSTSFAFKRKQREEEEEERENLLEELREYFGTGFNRHSEAKTFLNIKLVEKRYHLFLGVRFVADATAASSNLKMAAARTELINRVLPLPM
jgi:hypothetical protein